MNTENNTGTAVALLGDRQFNRINSAGKPVGVRVGFMQSAPAGDVRKALKLANPSLTNKQLQAKVRSVVKGESTKAREIATLVLGRLCDAGFTPVLSDINAKETKATIKLEKFGVGKVEATEAARTLSSKELLELAQARAEEEQQEDGTIDIESTQAGKNGADAADSGKQLTEGKAGK